jgi:N-acetylneuraminic acid mutarotase
MCGVTGLKAEDSVAASESSAASLTELKSDFPSLPVPITSFGACILDDWVYVYGGHTGTPHKYSLATTLFTLQRSRVDGSGEWESLPSPARAQGASLVAHHGKLIRVGGLVALNSSVDDSEHLQSLADVQMFDPKTHRWSDLPDLPGPRSSHDAVVVNDKLYVFGGWKLEGSRRGTWYEDGCVLDLSQPEEGWQPIAQPFKRRAIAVGAVGDWIVVLGGMDSGGQTSRAVNLYHLSEGTWHEGPDLPDSPMDGFGAAVCVLDDDLYVSMYHGQVLKWRPGAENWADVGVLESRRFFHRMLPGPEKSLLLIGGASSNGHTDSVEVFHP